MPKLIKAMPALTELNVRGNRQFGDGHAKALAKCPEFAQLRVLDVGWTEVNAEGIEAIACGKHTGLLSVLKLMPNIDNFSEIPAPGRERDQGIAIVESLTASKQFGQLQELELSYRDIGDEGVKILANARKAFPALRRLHLDYCGLTMKGAKLLAESALGGQLLYLNLRYSTNLKRLHTKLQKMFPNAHVEEPPQYDE